ncbi:MAG TPA: PAS domain-containing protein, partial [Desulfosarcina sp.]|nr:PAS domain-containing protein [Desulfosarcina sp.]
MSGLARQLRWLIGIRLLVITSVALPYALLRLSQAKSAVGPTVPTPPGPSAEPAFDLGFLFVLALLTYLACAVYWALLKVLDGHWVFQGYLQFSGDLLLITVLIAQFEGPSNPFSLLYLIIIGAASVLLRRQAAFTIATLAYLFYAGVILGPFILGREPWPQEAGTWFILIYNLAVHLGGFYGVALLTYHLVHRVARAEQELEEKREDLADLQVIHRDVIQSINSGLITTDMEGTVTSVNRSGAEILGSAARRLLGRPIYELPLLSQSDWQELSRAALAQTEQVRSESTIERGDGVSFVGFSLSKLTNAENVQEG